MQPMVTVGACPTDQSCIVNNDSIKFDIKQFNVFKYFIIGYFTSLHNFERLISGIELEPVRIGAQIAHYLIHNQRERLAVDILQNALRQLMLINNDESYMQERQSLDHPKAMNKLTLIELINPPSGWDRGRKSIKIMPIKRFKRTLAKRQRMERKTFNIIRGKINKSDS